MLLLSGQSFGVNNFDIRNNFLSTACVYVCVCLGKRKGEKVIAPHLVYVLVIYLLSAVYIPGNILTFQKLPCHFRNNWPVPCAEQTPRPVDFFSHATKLPKCSLSFFYCWQCVNMSMSATITIKLFCDWDLSLVRCHTRYIRMKHNCVNSRVLKYGAMWAMYFVALTLKLQL